MRRTHSRASQTRRGGLLRANLEGLEMRRLLASVAVSDGVLKISNQTAALSVTAIADNQFNVQDGATNHGNFTVTKGVEIKGTKNPDSMTVDMAGFTLGGTLKINSGDGNDAVHVKGSGFGGVIVGDTTIETGNQDDEVFINDGTSTLTFGKKLKITDSANSDSVNIGNASAATSVLGNLEIQGYGLVNLGKGAYDSYGADISISVDRPGSVLHVNEGQVGGSELVTVGGSMTIKGGSVDDTIFLRGMIIAKDLKVDLGNANSFNQFVVSSSAGSQTVVNGNVSYEGGHEADFVDFRSGVTHGNATFNLKEGNDDLELTNYSGSTIIDGTLKVNAGEGNDTIGDIDAQIGGDAIFELGNGNHDVTFTSSSSIGGILRWKSGSGVDNLTLEAAQTYILDAKFGNGADSLTLDNAGATLKGKADGEGGVDTFNLLAGTVDPTFQLISFP